MYCRLKPWPTFFFYTSDIDGLCDRSVFFSFFFLFLLFITQFLHPGFHYPLSQPEFPLLQLMRSPLQDYKKPQNNTVPVFFLFFFYYALFPLATGVCEPADDSKKKKEKKKRLLERIPRVCCYVRGVNKHLPPALAVMPKAWSNSPDCRGSPTVCARSEPEIWSYDRLQREGARPDRCVCALWLGNIGVF